MNNVSPQDWIGTANDPRCTCGTGHCFFHNYPYNGPMIEKDKDDE